MWHRVVWCESADVSGRLPLPTSGLIKKNENTLIINGVNYSINVLLGYRSSLKVKPRRKLPK
jgi:hypothetical protein